MALTNLQRIGILIGLLLAVLIGLLAYDFGWKRPHAREASAAFEKSIRPGLPLGDIEMLAQDLRASRFRVFIPSEGRADPQYVAQAGWASFTGGGHMCLVTLKQGKAESVRCMWSGL